MNIGMFSFKLKVKIYLFVQTITWPSKDARLSERNRHTPIKTSKQIPSPLSGLAYRCSFTIGGKHVYNRK